jgi:hypothetical protein
MLLANLPLGPILHGLKPEVRRRGHPFPSCRQDKGSNFFIFFILKKLLKKFSITGAYSCSILLQPTASVKGSQTRG